MKPVPADLVEMRATMSVKELARHYRAGNDTVRAWLRECGMSGYRQRAIPDDLPEVHRALGTIKAVARHYHVKADTVSAWLGREKRERRPFAPVPSDFATVAPTMTKRALREHYRTSHSVVVRWIAETGIEPKPRFLKPPSYSRPALRYVRTPSHSNVAQTRTYSEEDLAADVLRRWGPVYRCEANGKANHKGTLWRIGNTVLTGVELIERSRRKSA